MVNYRRLQITGATWFFTLALADRRADTLTRNIACLREAFRQARAERVFMIEAIVVLPDHLHAVFTLPDGDADFSSIWRRIKTSFTQSILQEGAMLPVRDRTGRVLWQRRFWEHAIRDDTDFARHVDYIHFNPVKHGYVSRPIDWPYSSLHRYVRQGRLSHDWAANASGSTEFGERDATCNDQPDCP